MSFRSILTDIVEQVDGGIGAVILGYDGIAIDEYIKPDEESLDMQLLAVEYTTLLKEIRKTIEVLQTGALEEVSVSSGQTRIIVYAINDDFFVVLALKSDGNFGKGRYLLKRIVPQLQADLQ